MFLDETGDFGAYVTFLYKLRAIDCSEDGAMHPTVAGLLMFGFEYEIVKGFPYYFLDYQEKMDEDTRWTDRIVSTSDDWGGNIYDFYFRVYQRITQDIKVPFKMENGERIDDIPALGSIPPEVLSPQEKSYCL